MVLPIIRKTGRLLLEPLFNFNLYAAHEKIFPFTDHSHHLRDRL